MNRLAERVAIVTGGARGIGRATCRALAREGARVVVADIDADGAAAVAAEIQQDGGEALAVSTDVAEEASVAGLVCEAVERFDRLDILHNNAALTAPGPLSRDTAVTEMTVDVWNHTMAVNLRGQMLTCKHAIPRMLETEGGGSIVIDGGMSSHA
jgi:NAD(P)-dependent dehydrogenase (short-subunit alcohol dehydrogenase family)